MNKEEILQLNIIPDGKEAWLNYDQYQALKEMFERLDLPSNDRAITDRDYNKLYDFLMNTAQLAVPENELAIHVNAFNLIRRGYKIEEITPAEYEQLLALMNDVEKADIDDMDLSEVGGHRNLYTYLTKKMGLSVKKGRGPAWRRAKTLIDHYEITHQPNSPANQSISSKEKKFSNKETDNFQ